MSIKDWRKTKALETEKGTRGRPAKGECSNLAEQRNKELVGVKT